MNGRPRAPARGSEHPTSQKVLVPRSRTGQKQAEFSALEDRSRSTEEESELASSGVSIGVCVHVCECVRACTCVQGISRAVWGYGASVGSV